MATTGKLATLTFQVDKIRFQKDGFVIVVTTRGVSVSGRFLAVEGQVYTSEGHWENHATYGPQYKLTSAEAVRTYTPQQLGMFLVKQLKNKKVGETVIAHLVEAAESDGLNIEELLDNGCRDELIECVGSRNAKKVDIMLAEWPKIRPSVDLHTPLLSYGLSMAMVDAVILRYGNNAAKLVNEKPFDLITWLDGVSFLMADRIAQRTGISKTDPVRLRAALATGLRDATAMGDLGVRRKTLIQKTMPLVNESILENGRRKLDPAAEIVVPETLLQSTLDSMISDDGADCSFSAKLVEFEDSKGQLVVWYKPLIQAEEKIARRLAQLSAPPLLDMVDKIDDFALAAGLALHAQQSAAVEMALTHPVSIITGGPGVGKSATLKVLMAALDAGRISKATAGEQVAPTGKAAKRITESTGRKSSTIHSAIGFTPGGTAGFNELNPLEACYLVVDETSMVDTELLASLLGAVKNDCRVIFVGDVDQLPSVGPGQVLRDMIRSEVIPLTRLTKTFRFSGGIAQAASSVNRGEAPENSDDGQFEFIDTDEPAVDLIKEVERLVAAGVPEEQIQVLSPTHKGEAGCIALNCAMQNLLNPPTSGEPKVRRDSGDIRAGDRVIQLKNDKGNLLVNGDVGFVETLSDSPIRMEVQFTDKPKAITLDGQTGQHLHLGYAITVHKSQGAEAPYVLMALDRSASFMLRRNLVYTGLTRASKQVKVFGAANTFAAAVRMGEPAEGSRRTSLMEKLRAAFKADEKPKDALALALASEMDDVPF